MEPERTSFRFQKIFNVSAIYTMFYMELPKNFSYGGEKHDFWEMIYIDKGEVICTAGEKRFLLKSGEMAFHKPNEFHNHAGNNAVGANISILTFQCAGKAMHYFENRIFRLTAEECSILSSLFAEGLSCFSLRDPTDPLLPDNMLLNDPQPFGGSQLVKNLLEIFLIRLCRSQNALYKTQRQNFVIDGVDVPYQVKELLDLLQANLYGNITLTDIAKALGKGESTVKKAFACYKKEGIMKYYQFLKIREAKSLIREGKYNFSQISELLCFDSPQYFSKCFKAHTHMTPSQYKRSILK